MGLQPHSRQATDVATERKTGCRYVCGDPADDVVDRMDWLAGVESWGNSRLAIVC